MNILALFSSQNMEPNTFPAPSYPVNQHPQQVYHPPYYRTPQYQAPQPQKLPTRWVELLQITIGGCADIRRLSLPSFLSALGCFITYCMHAGLTFIGRNFSFISRWGTKALLPAAFILRPVAATLRLTCFRTLFWGQISPAHR